MSAAAGGGRHSIEVWRSNPVIASAVTKSVRWSVPAEWARSTSPTTPNWSARSRSSCCWRAYTTSEDRLRRFSQEARAASGLNHPNIVTVHDVDVHDGTHYITTEFVEGETLRGRLRRGRIPLSEALQIATQVADALAAAHREGIVHRDIKPENILLRPDGYVKVVDFGLAKLADDGADHGETLAPTRAVVETDAGVILGTVAYMSPEQARGLPVDARTDVWSLGVVLYEMIAGRRPFDGPTSSDIIALILQRDPPKLAPFTPEATGEIELVVETALAKDVDERYQTARDLLNALKRVRKHLDTDAEIDRALPPEMRASAAASDVRMASGASGGLTSVRAAVADDFERRGDCRRDQAAQDGSGGDARGAADRRQRCWVLGLPSARPRGGRRCPSSSSRFHVSPPPAACSTPRSLQMAATSSTAWTMGRGRACGCGR